MKENDFMQKARIRKYLTETMTDADYADDLVLLANTPTQAESLQKGLEQAARYISLYANSDITEFMRLNQDCIVP